MKRRGFIQSAATVLAVAGSGAAQPMIVKPNTWYRDDCGDDVITSSISNTGAMLGYTHGPEKPYMWGYDKHGKLLAYGGGIEQKGHLVRELMPEEIERAMNRLRTFGWYRRMQS